MELSTLALITGWSVGILTLVVAIIAGTITAYAIYIQSSNSRNIKESASKKLDKALKDPMILDKFIKAVVENEGFKGRFLQMIATEAENVYDARKVVEDKVFENDTKNTDIIDKFKSKEGETNEA
ncbi:hypothetical protein [Helicobacter sp. 11S02596-1]|uniref:hypothetical protein n=1 Tax=Helicobacter sp. 11S02596-1 TaxID=1476194 RepID=UPI000BA535AB|nr:hypothetical protein [Helicobacter sp. 11S02596-1]PAF43531.1 hypothetical protein BJI48_04545 [Helicobacter sp. 11S02596-1]